MPESRVSVLILAKNEAENLPECLATVGWANEVIVVVDRASRDGTEVLGDDCVHIGSSCYLRRTPTT